MVTVMSERRPPAVPGCASERTERTLNPQLPIGFEAVFALVVAAIAFVSILAVISILRRRKVITPSDAAAWIIAVLLFPILGALAWFMLRSRGTTDAIGASSVVQGDYRPHQG